jgi:hypothetical protein
VRLSPVVRVRKVPVRSDQIRLEGRDLDAWVRISPRAFGGDGAGARVEARSASQRTASVVTMFATHDG